MASLTRVLEGILLNFLFIGLVLPAITAIERMYFSMHVHVHDIQTRQHSSFLFIGIRLDMLHWSSILCWAIELWLFTLCVSVWHLRYYGGGHDQSILGEVREKEDSMIAILVRAPGLLLA